MITPGQIYYSAHPLDNIRIRVVAAPRDLSGYWGKADVETVLADGRGVRRRSLDATQLHESAITKTGQPRRTGYVLETEPQPMATHPLPPGTPVRHVGQQWASQATAEIIDVEGPDADGNYEYRVIAGQDFSRRLGFDNVMDRVTQWSSRATIPTEEPTR